MESDAMITRWEYCTKFLDKKDLSVLVNSLNRIGDDGWEFVSFTPIGSGGIFKRQVQEKQKQTYPKEVEDLLDMPIADMRYIFSVRAENALRYANIITVRELARLSKTDCCKLYLVGAKTLAEFSSFLEENNLTWGMDV